MLARKVSIGATFALFVVIAAALCGPALAADQASPPTGPLPSTTPGQPGAAPPSVNGKRCDAAHPQNCPPVSGPQATSVGELVVTGSRIKTDTYSSPAPMTVITAEQAELTGNVDTAQILQLSPLAAAGQQINNYFSEFVITGGPGVNTLSLLGLGAQRTLILLNGERMGPAGVGGTVDPIDLNTIPESQIDHIDILKDGASSIYGSDAIAGVVNIITKTAQDGGDLHVFVNPSQYGGGNTYQVNGSFGKTWDKGYATVGFDWYRQDPLTVGQRGYLDCSRDLVSYSPGGPSADLTDPATGMDKCWNNYVNSVEDLGLPFSNAYIPNAASVAGGGTYGLDVPGFQAVGLQLCGAPATLCALAPPGTPINTAATRAEQAAIPYNTPAFERADAISPVSRYTFTFFGGYDLSPHAQLYGSVLLNQRDSSQQQVYQFFTYVNPANPFNPGFGFPLPVIAEYEPSTQTVDYARVVLGVKGDLPSFATFKNWTYDLYGQYSLDDASYSQVYERQDRVNATSWAGAGTNGCDVNAVNPYIGGESMAQLEPGVACVPVNYFAAVERGSFTQAEYNFLYNTETGHTTYNHMYIEGSATGDIFPLPAGEVGGALGFQLRRETIDDVPGQDFIDSNVYNFSTEGITKGSENVGEAFGELRIPIAKGLPFIYAADLDISGRYSDYSTYGGNFTYKATATWKLTDWFELRGTYGTGFRAPALYELYLADQTGYYPQLDIDPCINYGTSGVSSIIKKNCASLGIPSNYNGDTPSATVLSGGGAGHLKAETSIAETGGVVFTPHFWNQNFEIAIDYFDYDISNQIQQYGPSNIVEQCMVSATFPNNPFCSLFTRDLSPGPYQYSITSVNNDYVNVAREVDQGMYLDATWKTKFWSDYKFTLDTHLVWIFYTNTYLLGGFVNNYLGSIGEPTFDGTANFKFDHGPWTINWLVYMVGATDDDAFTPTTIVDYRGTGQNVYAQYQTPFYTMHSISVQRRFDKFTVTAGIKNLFNTPPPAISNFDDFEPTRIGVSPSAVSQYDFIGRSFFVSVDAKF